MLLLKTVSVSGRVLRQSVFADKNRLSVCSYSLRRGQLWTEMDPDGNNMIITAKAFQGIFRGGQNVFHIIRRKRKERSHSLICTCNYVIKMYHCDIFSGVQLTMPGNISPVCSGNRRKGRYSTNNQNNSCAFPAHAFMLQIQSVKLEKEKMGIWSHEWCSVNPD